MTEISVANLNAIFNLHFLGIFKVAAFPSSAAPWTLTFRPCSCIATMGPPLQSGNMKDFLTSAIVFFLGKA